MNRQLNAYQKNREALLARIVQTLSEDERILAAWLTGSYASGNADALSDLDLTLVIAPGYSQVLCKRLEQVSAQTAPERLALISAFGTPAILHENNNNAPEGGTFTFVLYAQSAVMVDWTLVPQEKAHRSEKAQLLFEKTDIPIHAPDVQLSLEKRIKQASEVQAFFWMMLAVTAKYLIRADQVFVTNWLEELTKMLLQVERLITGRSWEYQRGSLSNFHPTLAGQQQALLQLGEQMEGLISQINEMGGELRPSPMPEIRILLNLRD
jgi:predicted nucleotidyltransferase